MSERQESLKQLEKTLKYKFKNRDLLRLSLTHRSYSNEIGSQAVDNNERLEFLGDSVLDLVISHMLLEQFPNRSEGFLSKLLASLINERSLAALARSISLGEALILGKGENMTGGRKKNSILADAFEAVIAAIYLDGGLKQAAKVIDHYFRPKLDSDIQFTDYKTQLQEVAQQQKHVIPVYKLVCQTGRDHEKVFETTVSVDGRVLGRGKGKNKKEAEQKAAKQALDKLSRKPVKKKASTSTKATSTKTRQRRKKK